MAGAYDHLVGELSPGAYGWLRLDVNGKPTGAPATFAPPAPGPDIWACSVRATDGSNGQDILVTAAGAPITDENLPAVDRRYFPKPIPPELTKLVPASVAIGSDDFVLEVQGRNFTVNSIIVFNGGDEPTTLKSETKVTTIVKPSLVSNPIVVPIQVKTFEVYSNTLQFAFKQLTGREAEED
jgi:hypothetical protein